MHIRCRYVSIRTYYTFTIIIAFFASVFIVFQISKSHKTNITTKNSTGSILKSSRRPLANTDDRDVIHPLEKPDEEIDPPANSRKVDEVPHEELKPYYFAGGTIYPNQTKISSGTGIRIANVYPEDDPSSDRLVNQMMFVPPEAKKNKTILFYGGWGAWWLHEGDDLFSKCPVKTCSATGDRSLASEVDLIMFQLSYQHPKIKKQPNQLYLMHYSESPPHTSNVPYSDIFNWTATYTHDSTIPVPFTKWILYDQNVNRIEQTQNYAGNKTKKVAWFVSNCNARNNRMEYARELQKHIQVDIYGHCGDLECPRNRARDCFDMLSREYKFYLAFENSNCREYITEKLYVNALGRNILPIVMGARPEDYEKLAPYKSYIHVEDFHSPKELAAYLYILDKHDDLYNAYFKWKGTGEFISTMFWCRICAMLHDEHGIYSQKRWNADINNWWRGPDMCTNGYWRDLKRTESG